MGALTLFYQGSMKNNQLPLQSLYKLKMNYHSYSHSGTYISTVMMDHAVRVITIDKTKVNLEIWDTAGMERHFNIIPNQYVSDWINGYQINYFD